MSSLLRRGGSLLGQVFSKQVQGFDQEARRLLRLRPLCLGTAAAQLRVGGLRDAQVCLTDLDKQGFLPSYGCFAVLKEVVLLTRCPYQGNQSKITTALA